MTALTQEDRAVLLASGAMALAEPPVRKHHWPTPKVTRPAYLNGLPTIATCKATHICIDCRRSPAHFYGVDIGYGVKCDDCMEKRRARQRLYYARRKGEA